MGFKVKVSNQPDELDLTDVLLLPGVGAFSEAMEALNKTNLSTYIKDYALTQKPLIGICLGMQLIAEGSYEHGFTSGLGLIPGEFLPFEENRVHIGWSLVTPANNIIWNSFKETQYFYFNHSYYYNGPVEFHMLYSDYGVKFAAGIRKDNIIGFQFHPEKSQKSGRCILRQVIMSALNA